VIDPASRALLDFIFTMIICFAFILPGAYYLGGFLLEWGELKGRRAEHQKFCMAGRGICPKGSGHGR